jgi:hypothetical protein
MPIKGGLRHLRRSGLIFIAVVALALHLLWHYNAEPAQAQTTQMSAIEPPPLAGGIIADPSLPDPSPPLLSYYTAPLPDIDLTVEALELPPPVVVIQQLPPIIMTRTCWHENYYAHGHRYYHGKSHCSDPEPVPEAEPQ